MDFFVWGMTYKRARQRRWVWSQCYLTSALGTFLFLRREAQGGATGSRVVDPKQLGARRGTSNQASLGELSTNGVLTDRRAVNESYRQPRAGDFGRPLVSKLTS